MFPTLCLPLRMVICCFLLSATLYHPVAGDIRGINPNKGNAQTIHPIDQRLLLAKNALAHRPDSAFILGNQALQQSLQEKYSYGIASSHQLMGTVFYYQGVYQEALKHLLEAEKLFKRQENLEKIAENLNQQGLVYYAIRQPDLAMQHHQEALHIYEQAGNVQGIAFSYGCLGRLYEKKQEYNRALDFQQKALQYYQGIHDQKGIATILENIGSIYEDLEKYSLARDYFQQSVQLYTTTGDSLSLIIGLNNLGDTFRKTKNYTDALAYTHQALQLATRLNDRYQISSAYKDLGKIYGQVGAYEKAYTNLEMGRSMYEDIYAAETSRQITILQTLFGMERKNNEIQLLENKQRFDRFIKIAMGIGLSLMGLSGGLVINRQKLKIRKNKQMMEQNQQMFETQTKLMHWELENVRLRELQLQQALDAKAKSLTAHTLHLIGKNKMLEDIRQRLTETLREDPSNQRKKLKNLIKMIEFNFVQDKDWEDFRQVFEQVHQDFFTRLQQQYPDLTAADIRLAALIKVNLPSKDIATTLGISQDSLRVARYRLKKKLSLTTEESLTHYIQSL